MKFLFLISIFVSKLIFAKDLNYIESNLFRFSTLHNLEQQILPITKVNKNISNYSFGLYAAITPSAIDLIKDIETNDLEVIINRLDNSFGKPFNGYFKQLYRIQIENTSITFTKTMAASAIINDRVFPNLKDIYYQDYSFSLSRFIRPLKNTKGNIQFNLSKRKVLDASFTAIDLVNKIPDTKIENRNWKNIITLDGNGTTKFKYFDIIYEFNSIPLTDYEYNYWNIILGIQTKPLYTILESNFATINGFISYSPFYGGEYDVLRTLKYGAIFTIKDVVNLSVFINDKENLGAMAAISYNYLQFNIYTVKKSYDDLNELQSRQIGLNAVINIF